MSRRFPALALLALLSILPSAAGAHDDKIEPIEPRAYYETLKREIDNARSSVTVCVYLFALSQRDPDSPVNKLATSLVAASRRGVNVEVTLDRNIDFTEGIAHSLEARNLAAYQYLKANGIAVWFDSPSIYTHSKIAVIDGETVVLGSGNWTWSSFERNTEANVLLRSKDAAREFLKQIARVPRQSLPDKSRSEVEIPLALLTSKDRLGLAEGKFGLLFDVYAFLLMKRKETGATELPLDFDEAAQALGVAGSFLRNHRERIERAVQKLGAAGLLERVEESKKNVLVRLKPLEGETISVPWNFWTWGWHLRLVQSEKELYILGLYYSSVSPIRPRWSRSGEDLGADLHFNKRVVTESVTALRRANLLEVQHDKIPLSPEENRDPNVYLTNPLYDPDELESALKRLEAVHGREKLKRARKWASLVYDDSDPGAIEELIAQEYRWGKERIEQAAAIIKQKNPSNPKRSMEYFLAVIEP